MGSKFRPLYDRLYIRVETLLNALDATLDGKKRARSISADPQLAQAYRRQIVPYWKQYRVAVPKKFWFYLFCEGKEPDPRYIPDDLWFDRIIPHFNNLIFAKAMQDKCMHNVLFPNIKRPETVVKRVAGVYYDDMLNLLTEEQAVSRCHNAGRLIVKPSIGSGMGKNIRFFDTDDISDNAIRELFQLYGQNFIVQKKMGQNPVLASLNPNSLNTIRIVTFLFQNEVHVLSAVLRVGGGDNEVDNVSQGGYQCNILSGGRLDDRAVTKLSGQWVYTDTTANGQRFGDIVLPGFDLAITAVCDMAKKMSHFRILGWDIAIDVQGDPVLVEYNVIPGQNQRTSAPTFGDLTEDVLNEVFGLKKTYMNKSDRNRQFNTTADKR